MRARIDWIEQLSELTGSRERSAVNSAMVRLLIDCLAPRRVAIHDVFETPSGPRLLPQARWDRRDAGVQLSAASDGDRTIALPLDRLPGANEAWLAAQEAHESHLCGSVLWLMVRTEVREWRFLEVAFETQPHPESRQLAHALATFYRNHLSLLDYAERDVLTGLFNRRSFDDAFYASTQGGNRRPDAASFRYSTDPEAQVSSWLVVVDVDHFKRVNDNFGHLIGDEVLLLLAGLMRKTFRHVDRLYRFGGEEFVILLQSLHAEDALHALERFRHSVETFAFPQVRRVTVSIGVTRIHPNDTAAAAFERADQVVYQAKAQGRNQVCCHQEPAAGTTRFEVRESSIELF